MHRVSGDAVELEVAVGGTPLRLHATWLARGWPADIGALLERRPDVELVVSPALSSGAREALTARGVSWVDGTGAADVRVPGAVLRLSGEVSSERPPRSVSWSATGVIAAEALLALRPQRITTAWLAEATGCSVPLAGRLLQDFDARGWTAKGGPSRGRGAHRTLTDPNGLLIAWARRVADEPLTRWFAHSTERDLWRLRERLSGALGPLDAGWTGWVAGDLIAPFTTQVPILHLRVSERYSRTEVAEALAATGARMTDDAGRIELWLTDARAFRTTEDHEGQRTCSWPRVYADLRRIGGRGSDAADHLRDVMQYAS